jgi:hypothetical protein
MCLAGEEHMNRVGQNHIYRSVYTVILQGFLPIYRHIQRVYINTVLTNLIYEIKKQVTIFQLRLSCLCVADIFARLSRAGEGGRKHTLCKMLGWKIPLIKPSELEFMDLAEYSF